MHVTSTSWNRPASSDRPVGPTGSTSFSRRRLLAGLVAAPTVAALLAACGDDTVEESSGTSPDGTAGPGTAPAGAIAHPTGADDLVLRIAYEGGLVPVDVAFERLPNLLVSGDGRVFTRAPVAEIYPGPLVMPMSVRTISEAGIQTLLGLARDAGLLAPPPDYQVDSTIADAPDTVVTVSTSDGTWEHRAYALALGGEPETTPARRALADFVARVGDLVAVVGAAELGPEAIHEPDEYRMRAIATDESAAEGLELPPTIVDWPSGSGISLADATDCVRAGADVIGELLTGANELTWFRDGGVVHIVAAAGVLPGDPPCGS